MIVSANLNTYKSAVSQTYSIAHDSTLPVYPLLRQLDEDEETVAAYMYVPKAKENRYWAATASFDDTPTTAVNEVESECGAEPAVTGDDVLQGD
ncbi:phage tail protein [Enterobacter cancerogenus]|uniref:phage tail protein n=1 Tax=Enterobacter cancerogenus TaxID=69218 RepID=UPI0022393E24|nr:phage tail protein [Enterobacter cancerogenus]